MQVHYRLRHELFDKVTAAITLAKQTSQTIDFISLTRAEFTQLQNECYAMGLWVLPAWAATECTSGVIEGVKVRVL